MIQLFWSILNITILLFFLYLFVGLLFQGKKIFEGKFKNLSIAILILGVFHIVSANDSEKLDSIIIDDNYNLENSTQSETIILEENMTMNINLSVVYSNKNEVLVPIRATSYLTGLVSGYDWKIESVNTTDKNEKEKNDFIASGILEWKLFGITIYSQEKTFEGKI
ncbi:hypothetical protein [Autumnicola musiva]|uniref:Uncharacterized protein n=1 Tax=Autumnicola musiva TaxID=3075589 RepID=A0ABU3D4Y3_9FLAO|nr:hypothetical protein [Zunongwangia sp. F117]MDT0676591.1 hypothetical protein [Zunongwangia sp. F117]